MTIKVAAIETAYGSAMWEAVAEAFTETTGIKVDLVVETNLEDVLDPQMQAGNFPDVVHLATGREAAMTEQFINNKLLTDLTDVLSMTVPGESATVGSKIAGGFTDTSLTNPYDDGRTCLAPMFYGPCGLFYNAGLFEEKGWDVPETWDEMWELGDKAKAEGIALFTYPTTGYFDAFFYALMYAAGGPEFFESVIAGIFSAIYEPEKGLLDSLLSFVTGATVITPWKFNLAIVSLIIAMIWQAIGYYMVMYMSSMAAVPLSLYEAASIDGAGRIKQFFQITLPLIWTNIRTTLTFFIISTINMAFLFIRAFWGTNPSQTTALNYMYTHATRDRGYSMAAGVVVFLFSFLLSTLVNKVTKRDVLEV